MFLTLKCQGLIFDSKLLRIYFFISNPLYPDHQDQVLARPDQGKAGPRPQGQYDYHDRAQRADDRQETAEEGLSQMRIPSRQHESGSDHEYPYEAQIDTTGIQKPDDGTWAQCSEQHAQHRGQQDKRLNQKYRATILYHLIQNSKKPYRWNLIFVSKAK